MGSEVATLVFATSGSGKTHFVNETAPRMIRKITGFTRNQFETKFGFPAIVDGDELIAETIGWPKGEWWETLPADEYLQFVQSCLEQVASAARNSFVVFGVFPLNQDHFGRLLHYLDHSNMRLLYVTDRELRRNMESRKEALPPGSVKPTDWQKSFRSQVKYISLWQEHLPKNEPMSFEEHLDRLFEDYLGLFRRNVRSVVVTSDFRATTLIDGVIKGGIVRVRFERSDEPAMAILFADAGDVQLPEHELRIFPCMSHEWMRNSEWFYQGYHKLLARHRTSRHDIL